MLALKRSKKGNQRMKAVDYHGNRVRVSLTVQNSDRVPPSRLNRAQSGSRMFCFG
ncbi:hypothetical protein BN1221_04331 [Brenneria goodwinii]|uniref:Uncharacterized protein n=1 Tax=Brenneria goodwinii TaxID=1109412 RepID=A0A0G4K0S8_9GAMM|nr:hypothetical protein BN1221_04331 [Brenneria goodwinii]